MFLEVEQTFINEIEQLKTNNTLIIVEGKKDALALNQLGLTKLIQLSKRPLNGIIEDLAEEKELAILTDLDKEGKKLYGILSRGLQRQGVKINNRLRNFLYTETKIRNIEGLKHYH